MNKGRQFEVDCIKFFAIFFMICIHIYEQLGRYDYKHLLPTGFFRNAIEFLGGPMAAPVFMFAMGMGMVYTRHNSSEEFIKRGCHILTDEEIEGFFEIIDKLLNYIEINFGSVKSLMSQLNTVANIHQPYVQMTWMRLLTEEQMLEYNSDIDDPLRLNCYILSLDKGSKGKIDFEYSLPDAEVKWSSENEAIAGVDKDGVIVAKVKGTTRLKAVLCDSDGREVVTKYVDIEVR